MALVGILSATDGIEKSIGDNFTSMGSNTISIRDQQTSISFKRRSRESFKFISYYEASEFKKNIQFPAKVSLFAFISADAIIKSEKEKSNPNCQVVAVDENYLYTAGYDIEKGRNINTKDLESNIPVCLIGQELKSTLFPKTSALGKDISIGGGKYKVIGMLKKKGSSFGMGGGDRIAYIPISIAKTRFLTQRTSYTINVRVADVFMLETAALECIGLMRSVRKLRVNDPNNFGISRSDSMASKLIDNLKGVKFAAIFIALITLLGASIGLMNIMLVSISERTREIGTRKAIGAKSTSIIKQFLVEALTICIIGGFFGILLGVIIGNVVSSSVGSGFILPYLWITIGLIVCICTGLVAGIYPAIKASRLDPIEALRSD